MVRLTFQVIFPKPNLKGLKKPKQKDMYLTNDFDKIQNWVTD